MKFKVGQSVVLTSTARRYQEANALGYPRGSQGTVRPFTIEAEGLYSSTRFVYVDWEKTRCWYTEIEAVKAAPKTPKRRKA